MDINKLTNHTNGQVNGAKTNGAERSSQVSPVVKSTDSSDKVTLSNTHSSKSEELYAKIELEKLKTSSFGNLKKMKAELQEYEAAKNISEKVASETALGKKLNDPQVWNKIAEGILNK